MAPSPSLLARADRILDTALELAPEERHAHVNRACGDDRELRVLVLRLLRWAEEDDDDDSVTGDGLSGALDGALGKELSGELSLDELPEDLRSGAAGSDEKATGSDDGDETAAGKQDPPSYGDTPIDRIGPYDVLREIGRGGAAVVFLARTRRDVKLDGPLDLDETSIPTGRPVALKVLRPGAVEGDLIERFRQERWILHELGSHPHIAKLLGGGTDVDGRPYLVLEYVEGLPIDAFCDEECADLEARLRLLIKVARAVEHAHGHHVIHRDVKPSNVLVDGSGEPKLLDFGISKLLDPEHQTVPLTRSGTQLMTPAYATPEQLLGRPPGPTTDVYQLGLLLYVLASGRFPYRFGPTAAAVAQTILDAPPRRLVRALHEPDEELPLPASGAHPAKRVAAERSVTVRELEWRLRDLDPIVSAALTKDPADRYAGPAELADALERYLQGADRRPRRGWRHWLARLFSRA